MRVNLRSCAKTRFVSTLSRVRTYRLRFHSAAMAFPVARKMQVLRAWIEERRAAPPRAAVLATGTEWVVVAADAAADGSIPTTTFTLPCNFPIGQFWRSCVNRGNNAALFAQACAASGTMREQVRAVRAHDLVAAAAVGVPFYRRFRGLVWSRR